MWDEGALLGLAARQHGAFSTRQVRQLGGDDQLVRRRVAGGRWVRSTSRVLVVAGAPATDEQRLLVAVLHAGPGAVASHRAAAWLWSLPGFDPCDEVSRPRPHGDRAAAGHRPRYLPGSHVTVVRGIPVTSLPRTIFDLAGQLPLGRTALLVDSVVTRSPAMLPALHRMLDELAASGRNGITVMRTLLDERPAGSRVPASGLEARFEQLLRNAGITGWERQVDVGGHSWLGRVDYAFRAIGLLTEIDSGLHHTSVSDVAADAARDDAMLAAGWRRIVRITDVEIWQRPWDAVDRLRREIAALSGSRNPSEVTGFGTQSA